MCRSGSRQETNTGQITDSELPAIQVDCIKSFINKVEEIHEMHANDKKLLSVEIDSKSVEMELDSGAPCSI